MRHPTRVEEFTCYTLVQKYAKWKNDVRYTTRLRRK
jgi:hypothetical protein